MVNNYKICFVTTGDIKSIATPKRALGMARPLTESGWVVHILMEDTVENRKRALLECPKEALVHFFPSANPFSELRKKKKLIRQINPDFLYICGFVFRNMAGRSSKCKKLVEHSELQSQIPDIRGIKRLWALFLEYYSILYSDGILTASKYLEQLYTSRAKRLLKNDIPILYFPYAFSEELFRPLSQGPDHPLQRKYEGKRVFVYLGTITRNYGAFTMIKAFEKLAYMRDRIRLVLIGKGRHFEEAEQYIKYNGLTDFIELTGYVEEEYISQYFSVASAFISPMNDTLQDRARCPSKLYMYLPFMKPVITCQIGEPFNVLDGSGVYYQTGSFEDMANKIENLIRQNKWETGSKPNLHSWKQRSMEFELWIQSTFRK